MNHGTISTNTVAKETPKIFLYIAFVKNVVTYDNV
jgi:hypothetical protein